MFARVKKSRDSEYLQIVENYRDGGRVRQRMVLYVGHYSSVSKALEDMPRQLRLWRSRATRASEGSPRKAYCGREADTLAERLQALRRLVDEHPDLVARDEERAERLRRRQAKAFAEMLRRMGRGDQQGPKILALGRCSEEG
jgi:hypothetical protein